MQHNPPARPVNPWPEYERRKREWQRENPRATAAEYEKAMHKIARDLCI